MIGIRKVKLTTFAWDKQINPNKVRNTNVRFFIVVVVFVNDQFPIQTMLNIRKSYR